MISGTKVKEIQRLSEAAHQEECEFSRQHFGDRINNAVSLDELEGWFTAWSSEHRAATAAYKRAVRSLNEDELRDIEALMWVGRGDGSFAECRRHGNSFPFDEGMRQYVLEKPLWKYLARA